MYKKLLLGLALTFLVSFFSCYCFANDMVNGVKNVMDGAGNAVEGATKDMSNASKDATGTIENKANEMGNSVSNTMNNAGTTMSNSASNTINTIGSTMNYDDNNSDYTATRTNAEGYPTLMGMTSSAWTWLIIGIATVAIVALVWYYSTRNN